VRRRRRGAAGPAAEPALGLRRRDPPVPGLAPRPPGAPGRAARDPPPPPRLHARARSRARVHAGDPLDRALPDALHPRPPGLSRRPRVAKRPSVAILGAGAGGLAMGIRLRRLGHHDFTIYEKSDGVGGTWRDNTYPGAACDVPSHL